MQFHLDTFDSLTRRDIHESELLPCRPVYRRNVSARRPAVRSRLRPTRHRPRQEWHGELEVHPQTLRFHFFRLTATGLVVNLLLFPPPVLLLGEMVVKSGSIALHSWGDPGRFEFLPHRVGDPMPEFRDEWMP